jgi:ankyrin repeat protein
LEDVVQFITERKTLKQQLTAVVNAAMWNGWTPLMLGVDAEHQEVCELLLSNGASPVAEDKVNMLHPLCIISDE